MDTFLLYREIQYCCISGAWLPFRPGGLAKTRPSLPRQPRKSTYGTQPPGFVTSAKNQALRLVAWRIHHNYFEHMVVDELEWSTWSKFDYLVKWIRVQVGKHMLFVQIMQLETKESIRLSNCMNDFRNLKWDQKGLERFVNFPELTYTLDDQRYTKEGLEIYMISRQLIVRCIFGISACTKSDSPCLHGRSNGV